MSQVQSGILPEHCRAAIWIEANLKGDVNALREASKIFVDNVATFQAKFPDAKLGAVVAFGNNVWRQLSGGEGATQPNFARALIDRLKTEDIHITLETAGYASWHALHQASAGCNLIMYDLKSADDTLHKRFTGVSNKTIVRNLARLLQGDQQIIIRIPVIPGFNDAPDQAAKLLALIASLTHGRRNFLGVELLPYHRFGTGKYKLLSRDYGWNCHSANVDRFLHIAGHYHLTVNVSGTLAG